ncbi:hypothetical protein ABE236_23555 [Priestia endophytica]
MPIPGFGIFRVSNNEQCEQAVLEALNTGYRLLDTGVNKGETFK